MKTALFLAFLLVPFAEGATKKTETKKEKTQELWSASFPGARPVAVFFDLAENALYVSVQESKKGKVEKLTLAGMKDAAASVPSNASPGPLRAFNGRLYWIAEDEVRSTGPDGEISHGRLPKDLGEPVDIALDRKGRIFVGTSGGALVRMEGQKNGSVDLRGAPVTGLFLLLDTLYILRGTRLQPYLAGESREKREKSETKSTRFCAKNCYGLERSSDGRWLTAQGNKVLAIDARGRVSVLLSADTTIGRMAYVYRRDPKEDFYVLPFPEEGVVRAYRMQ